MNNVLTYDKDDGRRSRYREERNNTYMYKAEMKILHEGEVIHIEPMNIKNIVIDYDYDNNNMPLIYIITNMSKKHGDILIKNQDKDTIIFTLSKCIDNSEMPDLFTKYIDDEFVYFVSSDINKEDTIDYEGENSDRDDIYNSMIIGLMSKTLINNNKKVLNGVMNGTVSSILYYITGHLPLLMEPIKHNKYLKNIFLPPLNSVAKCIRYLNNIQAFYNTSYRFFMDFDTTYLLSSAGNVVEKQGEPVTDILIKLTDPYYPHMTGMIIDLEDKYYYIESDGSETFLSDSHNTDKSYSDIKGYDTDGGTTSKSSVNNLSKYMSSKVNNIRIPNGNTTLLSNIESDSKNNAVQMSVFLEAVDTEIFTINKRFIIDANEVYKEGNYSGEYLLCRRRDMYIREDDRFDVGTTLVFKKIG